MNNLEAELAARAQDGYKPITVKELDATLRGLGYRLDRDKDCHGNSQYMAGPRAWLTYPCITTGVREIDTGLSAFHVDARRDANFATLQEMRMNQSHFAVIKGSILEI